MCLHWLWGIYHDTEAEFSTKLVFRATDILFCTYVADWSSTLWGLAVVPVVTKKRGCDGKGPDRRRIAETLGKWKKEVVRERIVLYGLTFA